MIGKLLKRVTVTSLDTNKGVSVTFRLEPERMIEVNTNSPYFAERAEWRRLLKRETENLAKYGIVYSDGTQMYGARFGVTRDGSVRFGCMLFDRPTITVITRWAFTGSTSERVGAQKRSRKD